MRWYRETIDAMLADEVRLRRQPHWSAAAAVGDAEWLERHARDLSMKRFEIREAHTVETPDEYSVRTFFLGWQNQSKIP